MPLTASRAQVMVRMVNAASRCRRAAGSLGRTLTLALLGLTLVLGVIAALSVGDLLSTRQQYEDALARSYQLEAASARLLAVGVLEEEALGRTDAAAPERAGARGSRFDRMAAAGARAGRRATPRACAWSGSRVASQRRTRRPGRRCPAPPRARAALARSLRRGPAGTTIALTARQERAAARRARARATRPATR